MFVGLVTETDAARIRLTTPWRDPNTSAPENAFIINRPQRGKGVCDLWLLRRRIATLGRRRCTTPPAAAFAAAVIVFTLSPLSSCSFFLQPNCLLFCCLGFSEHEMRFVWPNINPCDAYVEFIRLNSFIRYNMILNQLCCVSICVFLLPDLCWLVKMLRPCSADVRD